MDIENLGSCVSQNMWLRAEDVGQKELSWLCTGSEICSGKDEFPGNQIL